MAGVLSRRGRAGQKQQTLESASVAGWEMLVDRF